MRELDNYEALLGNEIIAALEAGGFIYEVCDGFVQIVFNKYSDDVDFNIFDIYYEEENPQESFIKNLEETAAEFSVDKYVYDNLDEQFSGNCVFKTGAKELLAEGEYIEGEFKKLLAAI